MTSLLAILLVVNSTRGHHYLFSYPPDPKRSSLYKGNISHGKDFTVGSSMTTHRIQAEDRLDEGTNDNGTKKRDIFAGRDTIFNIDVTFLADTLAPKLPLCDRKFQLSMDDLTFVGHPVSLSSPQQQQQSDVPAEENSDHVTSPLPSPSQQTNIQFSPSSPQSPSFMHTNKHHDNVDHSIDSSSSDDLSDQETTDDNESISNQSPTSIHMTLFHVVYVMSPPDLELNAQVETLYKNVILRYSSALRYEQLRCGYVQEEIEKVLGLKEEAYNKGTPYDQVMQEILQVSSLARDIKQIYLAISSNKAAHVIVNDFIDLSLQIPSIEHTSSSISSSIMDREAAAVSSPLLANGNVMTRAKDHGGSSLMDIYSVAGYEYDNYPVICPYHTLLLLEDPEEVLKNMPLDASPTLVQLVQILTPTQSLQELHLLLDCSLAQIYRLAAHLIYWRKAKLIHTISTRNIYVVSPQYNPQDMNVLEAEFRSHIPHLSLPLLLSKLSHAQQYHQVYHVKELKNQYLEAITFLIRKDVVVQLHMYLVLLVPPPKGGNETPQSETMESEMSASPNHEDWLKRATYERAPKEVAELFERLRRYMNGQYHIEEIVYREGISRKQLGLVLKYYRDKIVTVYHY